jgi:hypothetical protein
MNLVVNFFGKKEKYTDRIHDISIGVTRRMGKLDETEEKYIDYTIVLSLEQARGLMEQLKYHLEQPWSMW